MITDQMKMNPDGSLSTELKELIKPVGKLIIPYGFKPENQEVIFALKLYNMTNFNEKLAVIIDQVNLAKTKTKVSDKISEGFVFPIIDQHLGYDGRHSLVITEKEFIIFKEHKEGNAIVKKLPNLKKALDYISKNLFYFEV